MVIVLTIFSERLKDARDKKSLTQQQLATKLGISTSVIGDIESGRRVASKRTATKLADFFGTSAEYWFDEKEVDKYFDNRPVLSSIEQVLTALISSGKITDSKNIPNEAWDLIKEAAKIEIEVMLLNK